MKMRLGIVMAFFLLVIVVACKKNGSNAGIISSGKSSGLTGTWNGSYNMVNQSISTVTFIISQIGSDVAGNFTSSRGSGTISGSVVNSSFTFTLVQLTTCAWTLFSEGTIVNSSSFSVTYAHATDIVCLGQEDIGTGSFHK
jgi:hypothetical protein